MTDVLDREIGLPADADFEAPDDAHEAPSLFDEDGAFNPNMTHATRMQLVINGELPVETLEQVRDVTATHLFESYEAGFSPEHAVNFPNQELERAASWMISVANGDKEHPSDLNPPAQL